MTMAQHVALMEITYLWGQKYEIKKEKKTDGEISTSMTENFFVEIYKNSTLCCYNTKKKKKGRKIFFIYIFSFSLHFALFSVAFFFLNIFLQLFLYSSTELVFVIWFSWFE